jgi:LysM repeat protein
MLRKIVISSLVLTLAGGLSACSTVTDNIPTVKIERKAKRVKTVETRHHVQTASYTAPKVQKAEAAMVCENDNMRGRAADRDMKNDMARVLILEEGGRSSKVIADVEVNCRDYFQSQSQRVQSSRIVQTIPAYTITQSAPTPTYSPQTQRTIIAAPAPSVKPNIQPRIVKASTRVKAADGYYYSIKKGDTLYGIARENCSSVKDISKLNGISDPTKIEIHQIIRLPAQKCNALK